MCVEKKKSLTKGSVCTTGIQNTCLGDNLGIAEAFMFGLELALTRGVTSKLSERLFNGAKNSSAILNGMKLQMPGLCQTDVFYPAPSLLMQGAIQSKHLPSVT